MGDPVVVSVIIEISESYLARAGAPLGERALVRVLSHAAEAVTPLPDTETPRLVAADAPYVV